MTTAAKTTAIGSLPHHNIDSALEFSLQLGIPFLPQIPIRNPWEYMIAQALEGLPGLGVDRDGSTQLNLDIWNARTHHLKTKLDAAFERSASDSRAFEAFEPSNASSSCWQPFLWELGEREIKTAKIQIAGPMTAQWAIGLNTPGLDSQIVRLVLARALAMTRQMQQSGIQPILYIDEPGLYGFSQKNPRHMLAMQELKLMIRTLQKEAVKVGVHCCSETDWDAVLQLELDYLSIDTRLSLPGLLADTHRAALDAYLKRGGKLSLGVIPTSKSQALRSMEPGEGARALFTELLAIFEASWLASQPELLKKALSQAIFTPACGLALHSIADAEYILELLKEFAAFAGETHG